MDVVASAAASTPRRRGIAAFPLIPENPYQRLLYAALAAQGLGLDETARLRVGWLVRSRGRVGALHVHWPQGLYRHGGRLARAASLAGAVLLAVRLAAARALRYRILWTIHQVRPHEDGGAADTVAAVALAATAHTLLVHDAETGRRARAAFPWAARKLVEVPHGPYTDVYSTSLDRDDARRRLGIPSEALVFLAFGHVRAYKGLDILLAAFERTRVEDAVLVVAGLPVDGASEALVRQRAAIDTRILPLLEFIPDDRVADLFAAADAAVISRADGGTSGALILALSLATPAVVPSSPTYLHLIGDGAAGWAFDAGDPASLATALESVAHERSAIGARAAAAQRAAARLSWREAARRTAAAAQPGGRA